MPTPLALLGICWLAGSLTGQDLTKVYPATLDYFEGQPTREWTCTKDDVWELASFHFEHEGELDLRLGRSVVVFGVAERNVVWAALFPDEPGVVKGKGSGDGEHVSSIWMRFNPRHLGELFPAKTVRGHGPDDQIAWAKRLCAWKIASCWQANNLPVIPKRGSIVLDCETLEGPRRFFVVEREKGTVELIGAFEPRALPALVPIEKAAAVRAFDAVWDAFDKEYAKFHLLPDLDWKRAGEEERERAARATSTYELAVALDGLTARLCDLHVWVRCGSEFLQGYARTRPLNASFKAVQNAFPGLTDTRHDFHWARTEDGIGYVLFYKLGDAGLPDAFDAALEELGDCWSLVVDLRFNGGGNEDLAQLVAGRFADEKRTYSLSQYRNGPRHEDLGPRHERGIEPRGPWRFESPVVLLQGQRTFSSAESMALMFAQCPQVTTMGDRTGGSSGNPRTLELEGGLVVSLPRWNDMDPAGNPLERAGAAPEVAVEAGPETFTALQDPVLEAALARLRAIRVEDRAPGKR